MCSVFLIKHPC